LKKNVTNETTQLSNLAHQINSVVITTYCCYGNVTDLELLNTFSIFSNILFLKRNSFSNISAF